MADDEMARAILAELKVQFEPRWPECAMEWARMKHFFIPAAQADWATFMVDTLKPFTLDLWVRGAAYKAFGRDLSDSLDR